MTHHRYMFASVRLNELITSHVSFRNCRVHFCVLTTFLETAVYLDASRLGIYPPLFTSPSGDSCILFILEGALSVWTEKICWNKTNCSIYLSSHILDDVQWAIISADAQCVLQLSSYWRRITRQTYNNKCLPRFVETDTSRGWLLESW